MKKIYIALAAAAMSVTCMAGIIRPEASYLQDFASLGDSGDPLPDGWVTYGKGYRPLEQWHEFFNKDGQGPYFRLMKINGIWGAFSNSSFVEDIAADEWLVTPPIHVNTDEDVLLLTANAYGSYGLNEYRVFISDKGNTKADFTSAPVIVTSLYGSKEYPTEKMSAVALKGYEGKDIHLAFVNRSKDAGLLGISDIKVAPKYYMDIVDETIPVVPAGEKSDIRLITKTYTSSKIKGLKAELTTSTGLKQSIEYNNTIFTSGSQVTVNFPDIEIPDEGVDYTVTITPNITDAQPTIVTGTISVPSTSYPPVAVVEEFTGTWCQFCPRGAAFMDYYKVKYNGGEKGQVIGIALHSDDPMMMTDNSYIYTAINTSGSSGFPGAFFNRMYKGDPSDEHIVTTLLAETCYSMIRINKVQFDPSKDDRITVDFSIENAYSKNNMDQRVAFVTVENNVKGDDDYYQINSYSGVSRQAIEASYGVDLWPYFKFYAESKNPVLGPDMVYNHVARGIYPDYAGLLIEGSYEVGTPYSSEITFDKPQDVAVWDNIAIIALLINNKTGKIIYANEVDASEFNKDLSDIQAVTTSGSDNLLIEVSDGKISVNASSAVSVDLFGIDGSLKGRYSTSEPTLEIPSSGLNGMIIVRATSENSSAVKKVVIKD